MAKRARTERREAQRRRDKLAADRRKLFALEPGGAADHPIEVRSASQIEPHARSLECPRCGPHLRIADQSARVVGQRVRRTIELRCLRCGEARTAHFVIVEPLLQ